MPAGLQIYDSSGNLRFDSTTAKGGVFVDSMIFAPGSSGVLTFPDFAGATPLVMDQSRTLQDPEITVDTLLGYPRVTVPVKSEERSFLVVMK